MWKSGIRLVVGLLAMVVVSGCSGSDDSADETICKALASVGVQTSSESAEAAVAEIRGAGSPSSPTLQAVQDKVAVVGGDQIALAARFDDLADACDAEGVALSLAGESSSEEMCRLWDRVDAELAAGTETAREATADLASRLPASFRDDAALFYYPGAGDPGPDADAGKAIAAGERLDTYRSSACN